MCGGGVVKYYHYLLSNPVARLCGLMYVGDIFLCVCDMLLRRRTAVRSKTWMHMNVCGNGTPDRSRIYHHIRMFCQRHITYPRISFQLEAMDTNTCRLKRVLGRDIG